MCKITDDTVRKHEMLRRAIEVCCSCECRTNKGALKILLSDLAAKAVITLETEIDRL